MSAVRDPAFWKRFSTAAHLDEEQLVAAGGRKEAMESNQWLVNTQRKKRGKYACICWLFWILFFAVIAGVVVAVIVLIKDGTFNRIRIGNRSSVSSSS